jgi:LysM repeat protein
LTGDENPVDEGKSSMSRKTSSQVIEAYRQHRESRFNTAGIAKVLFFSLILIISIYITLTGGSELPALIGLQTNTPASTLTPIETLTEDECNCSPLQEISSQAVITVIVVVSPTIDIQSTSTKDPTITIRPSNTFMPVASVFPTPTTIIYIVKTKDTLSEIALRYNVTIEAIQAANGMGESTLIVVGQTLIIPR